VLSAEPLAEARVAMQASGGGAASKRSLQTAEDIGRKAWMPGSVSVEGDERVSLVHCRPSADVQPVGHGQDSGARCARPLVTCAGGGGHVASGSRAQVNSGSRARGQVTWLHARPTLSPRSMLHSRGLAVTEAHAPSAREINLQRAWDQRGGVVTGGVCNP
jgi:hypothetical protein